jgi:hypothetical protein
LTGAQLAIPCRVTYLLTYSLWTQLSY